MVIHSGNRFSEMKAWTWVLCSPLPDDIFGNLQIIRCTPSQVCRVKLGGETTHNCWVGEQSHSVFPISVCEFQARGSKHGFLKPPNRKAFALIIILFHTVC